MRVSANRDDPGHDNFVLRFGSRCRCFLDGVEVTLTVTADDEEGWVLRAKPDPRFLPEHIVYCEPGTDEIAMETLRGKVEIRPWDAGAA